MPHGFKLCSTSTSAACLPARDRFSSGRRSGRELSATDAARVAGLDADTAFALLPRRARRV